MCEDVKSENLVAYLIHRGPAEPNHWFRTVPIGQSSVSIIGGLVEPDVVSVEQPTIRETEVFGLSLTVLELGNIFTDGTMPAVAAPPGTAKRGPGHFFVVDFLLFCGRIFGYEKS